MKKIIGMLMSLLMVCSMSVTPVFAAETTDFSLEAEMELKKAAGAEIYEICDDNGNVMGYYEANAEISGARSTSYNISWTVPANNNSRSTNVHSFVRGDEINVSISQNPTGAGMVSYIGLYDNDSGNFGFTNASITTNGWSGGVIRVGHTGHFSLAISNSSTRTISYSGRYWF